MAQREELPGIPTEPSAPAAIGPSRPALAPGQLIAARYEIRGRIGMGGMGSVWRAHDRELEEEIALKVILAEREADRSTLERFRREVKIARRITHPGVCRVFDYGEADGLRFLTMELIEGRTLRTHLAAGPLEANRALDIARQVAEGLAAAHAQGVIHRDLKPENVILREDGRAVVVDFGLARSPVTEHKSVGDAAGTLTYMSPEQLRGAPLDVRSDVFALGLLTAELLTGRSPFDQGTPAATTSAILRDPPRPIEVPTLPGTAVVALDRLFARALAKSPEDRFASAAEMAVALSALRGETLSSDVVAVRTEPVLSGPPRPNKLARILRDRRAWVVAAAVMTTLGAAAIGSMLRGRDPLDAPSAVVAQPSAKVASAEDARPTALVAPFENMTSDRAWDDLCRSAAAAIGDGIRKLPGVQVLEASSAGDAAPDAQRREVTWLVTGSVQRLGHDLRLTAQIRGASGQAQGEPIEVDGDPSRPAELLERLRQHALDEVRLLRQEKDRRQRAMRGTSNENARTKLLDYYAMIGPGPGSEHLQVGKRLLDEAIEEDAAYVPALVERAYLQARGAGAPTLSERLAGGLSDLERALRAEPGNAPAQVMRCRLLQISLEAAGNPTDDTITAALDACGAALQGEPSSAHVRIVLARLYDRTCQDEQAMASLQKAHELDRSVAGRSLKHLAELALQDGKLQLADRVSRELVNFQDEERVRGERAVSLRAGVPPMSGAHLVRAAVLLKLGRPAEARAALEKQIGSVSSGQGDTLSEASALRGLLRAAAQGKEAPPQGVEARLKVLEAELRAALVKDPRMGMAVANAYLWTDPQAAVGWLGSESGATTCDNALRRALVFNAAGKQREAQQALEGCQPRYRWEEGCRGWVRARVGR